MSLKGSRKPEHKRINIMRTFKMSRLMLEQIRAICDENTISFSQFLRDAITQSISRYNYKIFHTPTKQDPTTKRQLLTSWHAENNVCIRRHHNSLMVE